MAYPRKVRRAPPSASSLCEVARNVIGKVASRTFESGIIFRNGRTVPIERNSPPLRESTDAAGLDFARQKIRRRSLRPATGLEFPTSVDPATVAEIRRLSSWRVVFRRHDKETRPAMPRRIGPAIRQGPVSEHQPHGVSGGLDGTTLKTFLNTTRGRRRLRGMQRGYEKAI